MAYAAITKPKLHFNIITYTGDGTSPKARTGVGFQPGLIWCKQRDEARSHQWIDSVRGPDKTLQSNVGDAEGNQFSHGYLQSIDSDGFTSVTGSSNTENWNKNSATYVAWNFKAGTSGSNSDGSISSTVSANTTAGFSIVTYTGTGSVATVGHGLGAVPNLIIFKNRTDSGHSWDTYHHRTGTAYRFYLNETVGKQSATNFINDTAPTSSVFTIGLAGHTNGSGDSHIAYCFAEKKGYSKFGNFKGNGNANGSTIYTGFKPAWIMIKNQSSGSYKSFSIFDTTRQPSNLNVNKTLYANRNEPEGRRGDGSTSSTIPAIDVLSNGFKCRVLNDEVNNSNDFVYIAFAEQPFVANVGSNGVPTTAV